jgi:hypothetical protein
MNMLEGITLPRKKKTERKEREGREEEAKKRIGREEKKRRERGKEEEEEGWRE